MERADIIRGLIDKTGLSMRAFSVKAGIPYTTLRSMLERGIGNANVDNVLKVCKALGITVEELESMAEGKKPEPSVHTIAAHFNGKEISEEKLKRIENFIKFTLDQEDE